MTPPRRRVGLVSRPIDADTFVFDPDGPRVHVLNPTASAIFERCDGTRTRDELVGDLSAAFGADRGVVAEDLDEALRSFAERGLLDPAPSSDRSGGAPCGCIEDAAGAPGSDTAPVVAAPPGAPTSAWFDFAGRRVRFRCDDLGILAFIDELLAPLRAPSVDRWAMPPVEVSLALSADERVVVQVGDEPPAPPRRVRALGSYLAWDANRIAIGTGAPGLRFHAAAVVRPDGGIVLLPAAPDSGKSTLALGLVRAGWAYLGDESLTVTLPDGLIEPFLKPLSLDAGSWPLFDDLRPDLGERWPEFDLHRWHLDLRAVGGGVPDDPRGYSVDDIAAVVVPAYEAGADTRAELLGPSELAPLLAENAFNLVECGEAGVDLLVGLAGRLPAWRLRSGDLDAAVALVHEIAGDVS